MSDVALGQIEREEIVLVIQDAPQLSAQLSASTRDNDSHSVPR
jgi:hypothetical protein